MQKILLDKDWYVYKRHNAFSLVSSLPGDAVRIDLPYDAMFHEQQSSEASGANGYFESGLWYFQKELDIPADWQGKRILLKAEGLFSSSLIYLNGSQTASGDFGYVSTSCDLTPYIDWNGTNTLLIICFSDPDNSRWYPGAGILRPVYLYTGDDLCIIPDSAWITTERLHPEGAAVRLRADLQKYSPGAVITDVRVTVFDEENTVLDETFPVRINDTYHLDRRFFLHDVHLYSEDDPHLYTVRIQAGTDITEFRTGFRHETFDSVSGLQINGKTVKLRGACIHHDEGILGGISLKAFELYRVSRLKEAGYNAIRSAHNHASQELLEACDELGVYVLDEVCDMWGKMKGFGDYARRFRDSWQRTATITAAEDRNHPCVVGYSTGNEIFELKSEKGFETAHDLYELLHAVDDTRFVTNGINGAFAAGDAIIDIASELTGKERDYFEKGDVNRLMALLDTLWNGIVTHPVISGVLERMDSCTDVQGYNYMTARYQGDAVKYPQRIMLGTETYPRQIAENWRQITELSSVIGDFTWTGWDYMGELRAPYPALNNPAGDIDRFGFRRPVSYYREIVFGLRQDPYICVRPPEAFGTPRCFGPWKFTDAAENWTFAVDEGTMITVEVYSPDDEAELFLNGESVGRKQMENCYALFDIPYRKGELKAVGSSGREYILRTADSTSAHPVIEDTEYDGYVFSRISLADDQGNPVYGTGQAYCCTREGLELIAAASEQTVHDRGFLNEVIYLYGQGGFAVYRKTE